MIILTPNMEDCVYNELDLDHGLETYRIFSYEDTLKTHNTIIEFHMEDGEIHTAKRRGVIPLGYVEDSMIYDFSTPPVYREYMHIYHDQKLFGDGVRIRVKEIKKIVVKLVKVLDIMNNLGTHDENLRS